MSNPKMSIGLSLQMFSLLNGKGGRGSMGRCCGILHCWWFVDLSPSLTLFRVARPYMRLKKRGFSVEYKIAEKVKHHVKLGIK